MSDTLKPTAFRITDFKSIRDSGVCEFSADAVTVLAGQNESGKTSVLTALRDFDLSAGTLPITTEYIPEGIDDPKPSVSVRFTYDPVKLLKTIEDRDEPDLPPPFLKYLGEHTEIWITKDLASATFQFHQDILTMWPTLFKPATVAGAAGPAETSLPTPSSTEAPPTPLPSATAAAAALRNFWPLFLFFDSFADILPREISVDALKGEQNDVPQSVLDFLALAGIDIKRVAELASQEKQLGNYLEARSATITSDFLAHWKQRTGDVRAAELRVRSHRDKDGGKRSA